MLLRCSSIAETLEGFTSRDERMGGGSHIIGVFVASIAGSWQRVSPEVLPVLPPPAVLDLLTMALSVEALKSSAFITASLTGPTAS